MNDSLGADELWSKVRTKLSSRRQLRISNDREVISALTNLLLHLDRSLGVDVVSDDELDFDESEEENDYVPVLNENEEKVGQEYFTREEMTKIVKYADDGASFKSIQHRFRRVKHAQYVSKFRKYLEEYEHGTYQQMLCEISKYTFERFKEERANLKTIHDADLKTWALERSRQLNFSRFRASANWTSIFKLKNKIVSRKITKFVTKSYNTQQDKILESGKDFLINFHREIANDYDADQIFNTDQSGFKYEMHGARSLSLRGERTTMSVAQQMDKLTHSYTLQPIISMSGKLQRNIMIVFQEKDGKFGPRVAAALPHINGIYVTCSRSGKIERSTIEQWKTNCLAPLIPRGKCCLVVDSFSTHRRDDVFDIEGQQVKVEILPAGTTSFLQPLDVYFFRQWKRMFKKMSEHIILENYLIDLHKRDTIIKLHALIWNQLSADEFTPMIKYAWKKSGFPVSIRNFSSPQDLLFALVNQQVCNSCEKMSFMKCIYCKLTFCFGHLFNPLHFHGADDGRN